MWCNGSVIRIFRLNPTDPCSVVTDAFVAITQAHVSGELNRTICENLESYIEPEGQHLLQLSDPFQAAGMHLPRQNN